MGTMRIQIKKRGTEERPVYHLMIDHFTILAVETMEELYKVLKKPLKRPARQFDRG